MTVEARGRLASWRRRLPVVAVVVACVSGVVAAVTGAANPVSAVQFLLPGHWVYNSALGSVFHVDGSTGDVDARARVPGGPGDQVFQGDTSGYVVGESRITEFGKSSLEVEDSDSPPAAEQPVGVETAGGPYLVYRDAGQVVRLGDEHVVLSLGGPVGTPVASDDGTLWLPRTKAGLLCQLPAEAKHVSCPVLLPKGHPGALAVVSDRLVFVDTAEDTLHVVEKDGLGKGQELGVDAADDSRLASTDVGGRVAILDGQRMHLVDAGLGTAGIERAEPVTVDLDDGEYVGPVSTGQVVAVVNTTTGTLVTYDSAGKRKQVKEIPPEKGNPRLTRGEDDRIYVDGEEGEHVVVVDRDGDLTDVPIEEVADGDKPGKPQGGQQPLPPTTAPPKPGNAPPTNPGQTQQQPKTQQPKTQQPQQTPPPDVDPRVAEPPSTPEVPASAPGAPTAVNATAGDASATVNWGPAQDNRSPITSYRITWAGGENTVPGDARTAVIPGLANGTSYVFTVTAVNGVGAGPGAASNAVTPVAPFRPASAPTNLAVDYVPASGAATMSWAPPADLGGGTLTHYVVSATNVPDYQTTGQNHTFDAIPAPAGGGTITFTVKAVTADATGQQHVGTEAATTREAPAPVVGAVNLSQGEWTQEWCEGDPDCAWMHIELVGLQPNTWYELDPHSTFPGYGNEGHGLTTDANGNAVTDQFAFHEADYEVWVTATAPDGTVTTSGRITWEAHP